MASGVTFVLAIYRLHRGRALRLAKLGSKSCPPRSTPIPVEVVLAGSRAKKNSSISGTEKDLTHTVTEDELRELSGHGMMNL